MFPENYFIYIQLIMFYFITPGPPRVLIVSYTISNGLKKSNGARTIPQIFIGDQHIGGNDELQKLDKEGKLDSLVSA